MMMISLLASLAAGPACSVGGAGAPPDLAALYHGGKTYVQFRDDAKRRVQAWQEHYANAHVTDALVARAGQVPGAWYLLVVAEDGCGDSANTIPYLARLVDLVPTLEMRIINSTVGREVMEGRRTPDGRAATPTVVLLNERFEEAGCWIERPSALQTWFLESKATLDEDELYRQKYEWYATDAGAETIREVVEVLEAAGRGERICGT